MKKTKKCISDVWIKLSALAGLCAILITVTGCSEKNKALQGYLDADYHYVSAKFSGNLQQLLVNKGDSVKAGQLLAVLEQEPESNKLELAKASYAKALASQRKELLNLTLQKNIYDRRAKLVAKKIVTREEFDVAQTNYQHAVMSYELESESLKMAQTDLKQAEWDIGQKSITAPVDGVVTNTFYKPGDLVSADRPILSLLSNSDIKVVFYCPQALLSQLFPGKMLMVSCDGCTDLSAKISYLAPQVEYTPPVIYSESMRKKFTFRVEALPQQTQGNYNKLHPGQPVTVYLNS